MEELLEYLPVSRLYFGSHTPFLYTRASAMKLRQAPIDESIRQQVSSGNAERLLQ
jgi:predicted TIM-barrel fold metal-dependent hydrolase